MKRYFKFILLFVLVAALPGCHGVEPDPDPTPAPTPQPPVVVTYSVKDVKDMTLREKVGQLFIIRPEALASDGKTTVSGTARNFFSNYPCGGFCLYAQNITDPNQLSAFNSALHGLGNYPLLAIDEEGGTVARIAKNAAFGVPKFESMYAIGSTGNSKEAYNAGSTIGSYLFNYDFDVDFAPVADVFSNPNNTVIGKRSFSSDPQVAASMSSQFLLGLRSCKVEGCLKHFPGHGDTETDTHYGYAESLKTWEQMQDCEMIPFKKGIENGARLIMTAHISVPNVTGDSTPSTLSKKVLTELLRGELGFKGIIVTDGIEMGAIANQYDVVDACVLAIEAGADILLVPSSYAKAFDGVVAAVESGRIPEERLNESVDRILTLKRDILRSRGLLKQ